MYVKNDFRVIYYLKFAMNVCLELFPVVFEKREKFSLPTKRGWSLVLLTIHNSHKKATNIK